MSNKHLIIDTIAGEVMCKPAYDCDTNADFLDCYIGDNFDCYIGEIQATIYDNEEKIRDLVNELIA